LLYGIIRETKTTFEPSLRRTLNIIVTQNINTLGHAAFLHTIGSFFTEFFDPNVMLYEVIMYDRLT